MQTKIKIWSESGSWKLSAEEKNTLTQVFLHGIKGKESIITRAEYFDSGNKGISFNIKDGGEYYLMYSPGKVGLEDQSQPSFSLAQQGSRERIFVVSGNSSNKNFGNVKTEKSDIEKAKVAFKNFMDSKNVRKISWTVKTFENI